MTIQNVVNAVPAQKLIYSATATAGVTVNLQASVTAPAFLVVAENIQVASAGRSFRIRISADNGVTFSSILTTSANYFATAAATTFTNISATTASQIITGPALDSAGGPAYVQCSMLNWASRFQWVGQFEQGFIGSPDTFISGLIQGGADLGVSTQAFNLIEFTLDDLATTWAGTVSIYEYK